MSDQPEPDDAWKRWWRYANEDLLSAKKLAEEGSSSRWVCVMAQQAAEKAIKALLVNRAIDFPRTHDVLRLLQLLPQGLAMGVNAEGLDRLSAWAVAGRYPVDVRDATRDDAQGALAAACAVVNAATTVLGPGGDLDSSRGHR